jgi:hypothetical protein
MLKPLIRFRIRTIMIAIAALAVVMGALSALQRPFFDNMVAFTAALVFVVAAGVGSLALAGVVIARIVTDLFALAVHSWRSRN